MAVFPDRLSQKLKTTFDPDFIQLLLLCILFVITIAVFFHLPLSLRLDEAQSIWQTSFSLRRVLGIIAEDVHVPLYHILLYTWQAMLGNSVFSVRLFSLLFYIISIPIVYLIGKELYSKSVATYAMILFSLSPALSWFGMETRMYTLFMFISLGSTLFFIRILKYGEVKNWLGYTFFCMLGIHTHYFFGLLLVSHMIFFLSNIPKNGLTKLPQFLCVALTVILSFLPWLLYTYSLGAAENMRPLIYPPNSIDLFNLFSQMFFGFQGDELNSLILSLWPVIVLLIFFTLQKRVAESESLTFLMVMIFAPIIIVFTVSLFLRPVFLSRYLLFVVPYVFILVSYIIHNYLKKFSSYLISALIVSMALALLVQVINQDSQVHENYEQAVTVIEGRSTARDVVVLTAPFTIYPVEYYYTGSAKIKTFPLWNRDDASGGTIPEFNPDTIADEFDRISAHHEYMYVLMSYDQGYEEETLDYLDNTYQKLGVEIFSKGLSLHTYQLRYIE